MSALDLAAKIEAKLTELQEKTRGLSEEQAEEVRRIGRAQLDDMFKDDPVMRKMRFGTGSPELIGTKFARWDLSIGDIEWLYDVQQSLRGQRRVDNAGAYAGPSQVLESTFQSVTDAEYLSEEEVKKIDSRALDGLYPRIPKSRLVRYLPGWQHVPALYERWNEAEHKRAMDTAESGFGAQLVGAQYVRELWDAARAESRVMNLIPTFEMTDPTAYLPVEVDIPELLFVSESTANNSANYSTVKTGSQRVTVTAKKFVIHQMWSGEMEEDSILPYVPFLRRQATLALAHYGDSLVLNGDETNAATGNINLDDADPPDTKHYLAFDGIRHVALVDNTANAVDAGGTLTLDHLRALRGKMIDSTRFVDWGHPTNMDDLVYVADPETADRIAMLDEVIKVKQLNPNANLLGGEVGRIIGHPIISSMAMSKTEADGKASTTGSNNVKGQVAAFNRRGFIWGWRRRVRTETERLPATDQTRIVYSIRAGFGRFTPSGAASGIESAAVLYNISL